MEEENTADSLTEIQPNKKYTGESLVVNIDKYKILLV